MNFIFFFFFLILIILLFTIFAAWIVKFYALHTEEFIDKAIEKVLDKVSTTVTSGIDMAMDQREAGPWYLVVYTKDSNYPIWISNNTIRSVHPDPEHCKITINQFNGEYMVIENVISYELCPGNDMCEYDL